MPTFEQREFLSWYQLNAYFCPEREAPASPYINQEPISGMMPQRVLAIPPRTTSKDKTTCPDRPKLRTSRDRVRIQDLRSASVAIASRTSSPDADAPQIVIEEFRDDYLQPDDSNAQVKIREYQYAEQLDAIIEEEDDGEEYSLRFSHPTQHQDHFVEAVKPSSQNSTSSSEEESVSTLDAKYFRRRLDDMLHGPPSSEHSRTASSCTQVDEEEKDQISRIDDVEEEGEEEEHQQRPRRGPSFTESEVEEWYGEQPDYGPKSEIQGLSADLASHQFNQDACVLFLNMEKSLDDLRMKYAGSSELVDEAKWRLASIIKEMCGGSAIAD
ncbi:hypothetical protein FKW77_009067 [Venturia effusa]|uniref:Uncharacterized protein n=1 Tax=Venturia effusa TaxID=50376 RepID=A0A517L654_9PEZI|nr:hypothetical protein FKW77_009067 [Venturia effusa]